MCNMWLGLIYPDYSVDASLLLNNCKVVSFFPIEPREQFIRTESYSWSFSCQFALRQKLFDDIKVYGYETTVLAPFTSRSYKLES